MPTSHELSRKWNERMLWQINVATDDDGYMLGTPMCLCCGKLNVDPKDGSVIHPAQDKLIFDMLNNGFTTNL